MTKLPLAIEPVMQKDIGDCASVVYNPAGGLLWDLEAYLHSNNLVLVDLLQPV